MYYGGYPIYVAVYHSDGTVVVTHGGIECGQGLNTKVAQVVAYALGIPYEFVSVKATDNVISANSALTGGSITSDSVCFVSKIVRSMHGHVIITLNGGLLEWKPKLQNT